MMKCPATTGRSQSNGERPTPSKPPVSRWRREMGMSVRVVKKGSGEQRATTFHPERPGAGIHHDHMKSMPAKSR